MTPRPVFTFDINRCTGCQACEVACTVANALPADRSWRKVRTYNDTHVSGVENFHLSMACNHCGDAPCMTHCPARAFSRDARTDAVLIDAEVCIGCQYCAWVCPFDALRFAPEKGVMTKCDFCNERQLGGEAPACVESCPTGALSWKTAEAPAAATGGIPGLSTRRTRPALHVVPLSDHRRIPRQTEPGVLSPAGPSCDGLEPRITLRREWPLALFTMIAVVLVGLFGGFLAGEVLPRWYYVLAAGIGGMVISASHLGQPRRAWRALQGWRSSALSREILLFSIYVGAATLALLSERAPLSYNITVMAVGVLTLIAIDRVYLPVRLAGATSPYAAHALLAGLILITAWAGIAFLLLPLLLIRGGQYVVRKVRFRSNRVVGALRLFLLVVPGIYIVRFGPDTPGMVLLIMGELIDRLEYYREIDIKTPTSSMFDDLHARAAAIHDPESGG